MAWSMRPATHCEKNARKGSGMSAAWIELAMRAMIRDATRHTIMTRGTTTTRRYSTLTRGNGGAYASGVQAPM